ncbi:MAG: hypothetical protein ACI4M9_07090 [Succinivibrio sp.]
MIVKTLQKILISSMFVIPLLGFILTSDDYVIKSENRRISQFPAVGNKDFFSLLVNYYNDRLLFKIPVNENAYKTFSNYFTDFDFSKSQFTVRGIKGWLFSGNKANEVYSQHCEPMDFAPRDVKKKLALINSIRTKTNAKFYFLTGPDKHGIYPEFMDPNIKMPGKFRLFDKIRPYLESQGITVIDSFDTLRAHKDPEEKISLYYTDDTHWNRYAAKISFDYVMDQILDDYKSLSYSFTFSKHLNGDLIRNVKNPEKDILDDALITEYPHNKVTITDVESGSSDVEDFNPNTYVNFGYAYENSEGKSDLKVVLITDSFGVHFTPYAVNYFKYVVHLNRQSSSTAVILSELERVNPDLVLFINVERSIRDW